MIEPGNLLSWPSALLQRAERALASFSRAGFLAVSVLGSFGLSAFFFAPKFWLLNRPAPGSFEWDRALTFLQQCQAPLATVIDPAMRWRLLPPFVAYALNLPGYTALAVPYAGLLALLGYWASACERLLADRLGALLATVLVATTAAVITVTGWLGINDAWFLLGLVAVAAGRRPWSLVLSGLLAPWVDERFLLGWPLALFCRWWLQARPRGYARDAWIATVALLPYVITRGACSLWLGDRGSADFVSGALAIIPDYLPYLPLGWWMGLRCAWLAALCAIAVWWIDGGRHTALLGFGSAAAGMLAITALAADLSRSTNLLLPLVLVGVIAIRRFAGSTLRCNQWLASLAAANLLLPYIAVTYNKTALVWSLPLELLRLYKNAR